MSTTQDPMAPIYAAITPFKSSPLPFDVAIDEAATLSKHVERPEVRARLLSVGFREEDLDLVTTAIEATRGREATWSTVRDGGRISPERRAQREEGVALRDELIAGIRFNIDDRESEAFLRRVRAGVGEADLIGDLSDLAKWVEVHVDAFARDQTFDAPALVARARELAAELLETRASDQVSPTERDALRVDRDRALTHLIQLTESIRRAGRHAYRADPDGAAAFESLYRRRRQPRRAVDAPAEGAPNAAAE